MNIVALQFIVDEDIFSDVWCVYVHWGLKHIVLSASYVRWVKRLLFLVCLCMCVCSCRALVLGWTSWVHSHFANPSLKFFWVKKCKILSRFSTPVVFDSCSFKMEELVRILILPPSVSMTELRSDFWLRCVAHPPLVFTGVRYSKIWPNFGIWGAVVTNEATQLTFGTTLQLAMIALPPHQTSYLLTLPNCEN